MSINLATAKINSLAKMLRQKKISSTELTQHFLNQVKSDTTNSIITICEDYALAIAKQADKILANNKSATSSLIGIPIIHKDIFCTKGIKTSCASKMLDNFIAPYDATVVTSLKAHYMPILGKANMDEFAMGSSNETSYYGKVSNPWQKQHVAGGSSGGSAAAIASGLTTLATGTDTGGSIRQPASFCGISGIKPTYGSISRYGIVAYASSFDQAGIMGRHIEDLAMMLDVMMQFDERDSTSYNRNNLQQPPLVKNLNKPIADLKIGLPKEYFAKNLDDEVKSKIESALKELEKNGAKIVEVSLPRQNLGVAAYYILAPAEASSNLARYDGVRYGYRTENPKNLKELYQKSRSKGFGQEVQARIMIGTYVLSAGYYDAYYLKAQKIRQFIKEDFTNAFKECDLIAGPVAPSTAFKITDSSKEDNSMYLADIYTIPVNLAGLPAASIPVGFANNGLPVGMHLIGNYFEEGKILQVAHQYQQISDWHLHQPN